MHAPAHTTKLLAALLILAGCSGGGSPAPQAAATPVTTTAPAAWTLDWSDEFDGATLDSSKWVAETGGHGWGNN